jgi:hypothetical protein
MTGKNINMAWLLIYNSRKLSQSDTLWVHLFVLALNTVISHYWHVNMVSTIELPAPFVEWRFAVTSKLSQSNFANIIFLAWLNIWKLSIIFGQVHPYMFSPHVKFCLRSLKASQLDNAVVLFWLVVLKQKQHNNKKQGAVNLPWQTMGTTKLVPVCICLPFQTDHSTDLVSQVLQYQLRCCHTSC